MAINKVIFGNRTLIDLTEITVTADTLLEGETALDKSGTLITGTAVAGSGSAVSVVDTSDSHGGTIRTITAVSLAGDTVRPDVLLSGYTAHNSLGQPIVGTASGGGGGAYQSKTVAPSLSQQTITADAGYDALSSVVVNAMPTGSASTPATSITAAPTITVSASGLITASVSKTQSVTPNVTAGYISSGTAGNISVSGSNTQQLTTRAASAITPGTTDQTIASGTYLTGTQTIKGDANLVAGNIISGKTIFGVAGSVSFVTYYTGSSAPSSSLGSDGDIYLQTGD